LQQIFKAFFKLIGPGMDFSIAAILVQDGITSGAIYALLALALVLVFSVTRVIFIPQGEFVGALTLAAMQSDKFPGSALLLLALGVLTFMVELVVTLRTAERRRSAARAIPFAFLKFVLLPLAIYLLTRSFGGSALPLVW
jgi:branched-chain amino acid transport system permease protein